MTSKKIPTSKEVTAATLGLLEERGVSVFDIAEIVYDLQLPYHPDLTIQQCAESVERVLQKREIQHALLVLN